MAVCCDEGDDSCRSPTAETVRHTTAASGPHRSLRTLNGTSLSLRGLRECKVL